MLKIFRFWVVRFFLRDAYFSRSILGYFAEFVALSGLRDTAAPDNLCQGIYDGLSLSFFVRSLTRLA